MFSRIKNFLLRVAGSAQSTSSGSGVEDLRKSEILPGKCNCGCSSKPLTLCPPGTVDLSKYKTCPARLAREQKEVAAEKGKRQSKAEKVKARKRRTAEQQKQRSALTAHIQEQKRIENNFPALSRAEAQRRRLPTYLGNPCSKGHSGGRLARNGECYACKHGRELPGTSQIMLTSPETEENQEVLEFSIRHGMPLDKFFDASGMSKAEYVLAMSAAGAVIAYNTRPCENYGHSIRNKYGTCVVCDPKQLAFNDRANLSGWVYVAESKSGQFIKVGFTSNFKRRHSDLVSQAYAGVSDWELVYQKELPNAGRVEIDAHKSLSSYVLTNRTYKWDNRDQTAKEIFSCSAQIAISVIENIISRQFNSEKPRGAGIR